MLVGLLGKHVELLRLGLLGQLADVFERTVGLDLPLLTHRQLVRLSHLVGCEAAALVVEEAVLVVADQLRNVLPLFGRPEGVPLEKGIDGARPAAPCDLSCVGCTSP